MSRVVCQVGNRAMQGIKDQDATIKYSSTDASSSRQARKLSGAIDSTGFKTDKIKRAEESLRTVMYLSCWGPS